MSLNGALQIGRSSLAVAQAALQVAGNNMANAATEGYHRRSVHLAPVNGQIVNNNQFIGRGVDLISVNREFDAALQNRFRQASSNETSMEVEHRFLSAIETLQNELTDNDLSSLLTEFFGAFSEAANHPNDAAVRTMVVEQGATLASRINAMRSDLSDIREEVRRSLAASVESVNDLFDQIASLNQEIALTEGGGGGQANSLRDRRDLLIDQVAEFADITTVEQSNGVTDVFVNSVPVVLNNENRGIELRTEGDSDDLALSIRLAADGTSLNITSGRIGGLMRQEVETVLPQIDLLDDFASQLIQQVNRIHTQGQGRIGFERVSGASSVADASALLDSNAANLDFPISNGSFMIHVTNRSSGARTTHQINVDGNDMSLDDLVDQINTVVGVPNTTASVGAGGNLVLGADSGFELSFSDDTSGALTALGINTYFTGSDASDIGVNETLTDSPDHLALGLDHISGSTSNAVAIAQLAEQPIEDLDNRTLQKYWQSGVGDLALRTNAARNRSEAATLVRESIQAEMQAVSGVSLDEESINLLQFQRQYQASARLITVIDEMMQTLLSIA